MNIGISMNCLDCDTPLKLDDSLLHLNNKQKQVLLSKSKDLDDDILLINPQDYLDQHKLDLYNQVEQDSPLYNELLDSEEGEDYDEDEPEEEDDTSFIDLDNSFVILDGDKTDSTTYISGRIKMLDKVFKILSSHSSIDHPLSAQCANLLLENYKIKFDQTNWERDKYISFLKRLKIQEKDDEDVDVDAKLDDSIEQLHQLQLKQSQALDHLKQLELQKKQLQLDLSAYKSQLNTLNTKQLNLIYKNQNQHQLNLQQAKYKLNQQNSRYKYHLVHLDQLRAFNIYTTLFKIEFNSFPTINSYRLGYKIINQEINGALGQIVLLVKFLVKRLHLKLENYQIVPLGSKSYIVKISKSQDSSTKSQLNLFTSNEFSLGRLFNFNKLDISLLALLDVVHLIETRIKILDSEIELPYKIDVQSGLVGGKSIRITLNSEWTDGCKFLLVNLNWILLWTSVNTE